MEISEMTERGIVSAEGDRRSFLRGVASAVAAVGTGVLLSGSAYAAVPRSRAGKAMADPLPPAGTEIACSMYAANVPLRLSDLGALTLDFKGGISLVVRRSTADGQVLEVQGFRVEADLSPTTPNSGTVIALSMSNVTLTPLSVLTSARLLLVKLSLTVSTTDKATGVETVVASTDPSKYATLVSADTFRNQAPVTAFPLVNQNLALSEPVQLFKPGTTAAEGDPIGVLEGFDAIANQTEAR
ncbi:twin-arginine translocation signal domain-containing protein [Streptomyces bambusae]|uniref:Twin-arginine translocation signal domain-containing protein n=1 Tax=Streptomyces bambusae TaxID=1550616 RepID=A0ABS6Z7N9_9ACTN|nr:twin-arginine translocation signal domain-containing protein [Streptomyces bambusae]MBW5483767.1 twin-arginine translocation signal domain-containing protein [Streptomyces bambusae]